MELDDMKNLWKEEYKELEKRVSINEQIVNNMNMKKHIRGFEGLFKMSIFGRNMALIYMLMSFAAAFWMRDELMYSIPAILGGLAMLFSYNQHRVLKMPNSSSMSVVELQKSISKFRIHSAKHKIYDMGIVMFWLLTLTPIYMKLKSGVSIYGDMSYLIKFLGISGILIALSFIAAHFLYKKIDNDLIDAEEYLDKLVEFER